MNEYKETISLGRSGEENNGRESYVMKDESQNVFIRPVDKGLLCSVYQPSIKYSRFWCMEVREMVGDGGGCLIDGKRDMRRQKAALQGLLSI